MAKLTLDLDGLAVQSFTAGASPLDGGADSLPTLPLCTRYGCVSSECETVPCTKPEYMCPVEW